MQPTTLRAQLESVIGERMPAPFTDLDQRVYETASTGISALDNLTGGLARGAITEIFGPPSSGKTSILLSILAAATARDEVCSLIDNDAFTPECGADAGIDLKRLLWVRCRNLDQALKSTDLLLQGGGFGIVAIDLSDIPGTTLASIPLATWFRFQRTIEKTPTILTIISSEGVARTTASLALRVNQEDFGFRIAHFGFDTSAVPPHAVLFNDLELTAEIIRCRQLNPQSEVRNLKFPLYVRLDLHPSFSCTGLGSE
jgi:recombination protein RecA